MSEEVNYEMNDTAEEPTDTNVHDDGQSNTQQFEETSTQETGESRINNSYIQAFPSANIQLDIAKNEYEREKSRSDSLDNKAGIYIAAIVAIITVYIQILPFSELVQTFNAASKVQACFLAVALVGLAIGMLKIGFAFRSLSKAIALKDFKRVCLANLTDINLLASPEDQTSEAMIRHFKDIIEHNEKTNNDKAIDLSKGLNESITGFVILSICTAALLVILGWIK